MSIATPVPVLLYHSVRPAPTPGYEAWETSPERMRAQLDHLEATARTPIPLATYARWLRGDDVVLPPRPVVVTFDDGFANFCELVPLFEARNVPVTMFVPTAYVGGDSVWLPERFRRAMLTWSQVRELDRAGIEIGSHAHRHHAIDTVPLAVAREEIRRSRALLEDQLGHECASFAYPHGYSSRRIRAAVRAAGFAQACAVRDTLSGTGDDPFAIARVFVGWDDVGDRYEQLLTAGHRRRHRHERIATRGWRVVRRTRAHVTRVP